MIVAATVGGGCGVVVLGLMAYVYVQEKREAGYWAFSFGDMM
jgi:hypothetical protein